MIEPLFDVIIHTSHDDGQPRFAVTLVDRFLAEPLDIPGSPEYSDLEDAISWARGAVTAFMEAAEEEA